VEVSFDGRLKRSLEIANRLGVRRVVIVGEEEIAAGRYTLRDMQTGEQESLSEEALIARLAGGN
jgi:histidyl-tRNA synthetase